MLSFLFCCGGGGGVEEGFEANDTCLGSLESIFSSFEKSQYTRLGSPSEWKVLSSVVVCGVSLPSMVLKFIGGVEIGDGLDGSCDWGLSSLSCRITAIVVNTLKGMGGKFRSFKLGGTNGFWWPNPYGNVGSLESESIVTNCGSGEGTEEIVMVSLAIAPDSCVDLRIAGVIFLMQPLFADERSTKKSSESVDASKQIFRYIVINTFRMRNIWNSWELLGSTKWLKEVMI